MWIYQHKEWPYFTWDVEIIATKLAEVRHLQGWILGKMDGLGFDLMQEATLKTLTNDVIKSSVIEGEILNPQEVRSSIARRLGLDVAGLIPASRDVEGVVEMMLDATQNFEEPLTKDRLFAWHSSLFPTGRSGMHKITTGAWRTSQSGPMQVVSGPVGREKIHFEAPIADILDKEMDCFLTWYESQDNLDLVLKASLAHLHFVTIHPFEDGNGRIARAIADMTLARSDKSPHRFYSLSSQIEAERKDYYTHLEQQQRGTTDVTSWILWYLSCLGRALENAKNTLESTLFKSTIWTKLRTISLNERQRLIINRMLEDDFQGHMNTSKYATMSKCSTDTALRDIQDLKAHGIFLQNQEGGRSTSYRLNNDLDSTP